MDEYSFNPADEELDGEAPETPEDVAVLYTWANVHGGKYRDFSASRREFRAQQRHRMVEQQRQAELEAARAREEAAAQEMEEVRRLEEQARHDEARRAEAEEARRRAEENIEQERRAAQRHVEVAEELKRALEEAQREMEAARRRAEEQAARYAEADARYRASARQQALPGEIVDPYYYAGPLEPTAFAPGKGVRSSVPQRVSSEKRIVESYYRSKGSSEVAAARATGRGEEEEYGLFSSRPRARSSSAGRHAYTEVPSEVRRDSAPFAEARTETPEDTRERHRPDELDRAVHHSGASSSDEIEDDGYYDGVPVHARRSTDPAARNSAASNVYLPPRVQQAPPPPPRPREEPQRARDEVRPSRDEARQSHGESGERRVESSEDPMPGSPHMLEQSRARRRESAADVAARTTRRPRESEALATGADSRDAIRVGRAEVPHRAEADRFSGHQGRDRAAASAASGEIASGPGSGKGLGESPVRRPLPETPRGRAPELEERPEWLVRDAQREGQAQVEYRRPDDRLSQQEDREGRRLDRREMLRQQDRRRGAADSQMIPAADGGFNLPPLRDRAPVPADRLQPMPEGRAVPMDTIASASERPVSRDDSAPRPAAIPAPQAFQDRRKAAEHVHGTTGDPVPPRPEGERRRVDRASGDRLTRELRVPQSTPSPAAEDGLERRSSSEEASGARPVAPHPADTLQQSRERVAARWFALKGLMGSGESSPDVPVAARAREVAVPILAVVSLSGGVGKTSLVATVGRALSSVGERVLLADATPHGLLPYYFGARELRPDVVRTFSPPPGSKDAPVFMVNYEADRLLADEAGQKALLEDIGRHVKGTARMLLDLNATSAWLARRLAGMNSTILVPVAADMNSVLGIKNVERFFAGLQDEDGRPQLPYYILNQFDASLPLHLDVREVLRQQLGDRLLPVMIRRSPSVAEALAEGMTVMDYAPESPVTEDYAQLAEWVRKQAAPAQSTLRSTRWSER